MDFIKFLTITEVKYSIALCIAVSYMFYFHDYYCSSYKKNNVFVYGSFKDFLLFESNYSL